MSKNIVFEGDYFKGYINGDRFCLTTLDDTEILEARQGSIFKQYGWGYADSALTELMDELDKIKEILGSNHE